MRGERITFDDLHPGLVEYVHQQKGWPLHYQCLGDMPYLDGLVFTMMLHSHEDAMEAAVRKLEEQTEIAMQMTPG